ncbi:MAG: hypothetical protein PHT69_02700 [Bacteroidales bacterium]|nr:hypothetical protein [Bacteroidales bacterium]
MPEKDYINRTIIKLRRKYGKDELVAALNTQLSEKDVEIGKLSSEIAFLEDKADKLTKEVLSLSGKLKFHENKWESAKIECRKEELYQHQLKDNSRLRKELKELRLKYNDVFAKLIYLKNKNE